VITLAEIRKPLTNAEALASTLDLLQSLGFETTGWQDGRIQKSLIVTYASILAEMSEGVAFTANAGTNDYAQGTQLTVYSKQRFGNTRFEAVATEGQINLTNRAATAYTLQPGALLFTSSTGVQFVSTSAVTVLGGSAASPVTTPVSVRCMLKGSIGNVGSGTIRTMATPLAGVTCDNPGSPWYSTTGEDEETDVALQSRNRTQWDRLSVELISGGYENIARDAGAAKVTIDTTNPRGPGTLDVYVSGATAVLSGSEVTTIQEAFSDRVWATDPTATPTSRVQVKTPATFPLNITAKVYHRSDVKTSELLPRINSALTAFVASIPIGGKSYSATLNNAITRSDINDALLKVFGVNTVTISLPAVETLAIPSLSLVVPGTWTITTQVSS
jgi:uncharacterized phage protein gp47/JayE